MRERFEQVTPAPGEPFDQGLWRLTLETLEGVELPESAYPVSKQPNHPDGEILLCRSCGHYSFAGDDGCMNCGRPLVPEAPLGDFAGPEEVEALLERLARLDADHARRLAAIRASRAVAAE
jgi:hypothetical protein